MDLASLVPLVAKTSVVLTVFALGLEASPGAALALGRRPAHLLRSLLAMNVIMPAVAVALAATFDLRAPVRIALIALALSPVPPMLPKKQLKAGGSNSYAFGLLVTAAILSVALVPLGLEVIEHFAAGPLHMPPGPIARIVVSMALAPLAAGLLVRRLAPGFAARVARPLSALAAVALVAALVPILITAWPAMVSLVGNGTLAAIAAFVVAGLAAGHLLGGPDPAERTVLAISTASRHPGIALAIAGANFPEEKLVLPAVLLYLIASAILTIPYTKWIARQSG